MYGLVHRAVQCFAQDIYGNEFWDEVITKAGLDVHEFEAMLTYPDQYLDDVLDKMSTLLDRTPAQVSEDVGAYLVTHHRMETVRRLMRFGGTNYEEFVLSLDDLHDRVKLALPDLEIPQLEVEARSSSSFRVLLHFERLGFGAVLLGVLRAMADDYGALVVLEHSKAEHGDEHVESVTIELFQADFASGREFGLIAGSIAQ